MVTGLILIEGQRLDEEAIRAVSLHNAKHLVVGVAPNMGVVLDIGANSITDLGNAILTLAQVPNVTGVLPLALRSAPRPSEPEG